MISETLRRIGLSEGEIRIYTALLEEGRSALNKVHEKTGIERRNIYDILNKLIERGLVTYVEENKRRIFQVSHPSKIIGYIEEKKNDVERMQEEAKKELPSLLVKYGAVRPDVNAELFRGAEGIKAVWDDMLNAKRIYWIGSGRYIPKNMPHFFMGWDKRRVERKIIMMNLVRHELRKGFRKYRLEHARFLPKAFSGNPTVIAIYNDKVVDFMLGKALFAFVIESKELAESYVRYHRYLWEHVTTA